MRRFSKVKKARRRHGYEDLRTVQKYILYYKFGLQRRNSDRKEAPHIDSSILSFLKQGFRVRRNEKSLTRRKREKGNTIIN